MRLVDACLEGFKDTCNVFLDSSVARRILHPGGSPGPVLFHPPVPETTYERTTLKLNINYIRFGLLAQASY